MVALAVLFVAVGLGVTAAGIYASRPVAIGVGGIDDPDVIDLVEDTTQSAGLAYRALEPVGAFAARLMRPLSPAARLELTRKRIVYAGLEGKRTVEQILAQKAIAAVVAFAFGLVAHPHKVPGIVEALVLAVIASFVPDVLLDSKAKARQNEIARTLPDALDLLAITVEAGLGLEQALTVVTDRLDGALGEELRRMLREIELGVDRRKALEFLRERTDVRELSAFIVALLQADELGMAIGEVLRVQSAQVRLVRRQHAREQAAKTPVKILFPVIFTIFPAMFVVTIGPGAISIFHAVIQS